MATPILEAITVILCNRIETVTVANGYQNDVRQVVRPIRMGGYSPKDRTVVVMLGDAVRDEELSNAGYPDATAWVQQYELDLLVMTSEKDPEPIDKAVGSFAADVMKAVTAPENWDQFEGKALKTNFVMQEQFITADGAYEGLTLHLEVTYRTSAIDPYVVR